MGDKEKSTAIHIGVLKINIQIKKFIMAMCYIIYAATFSLYKYNKT